MQAQADGVYGDLEYVSAHIPKKVIRYWKSQPFSPKLLQKGWMPAHPTLFVSQQMIIAGAILMATAGMTGELGRFSLAAVTATSAGAYLYLAVFGSLISYSAYFWLLRHTTPDRLATISYVNPLVAVILGWALAGEALTPRTLIAAAVILLAVGLITPTRVRGAA